MTPVARGTCERDDRQRPPLSPGPHGRSRHGSARGLKPESAARASAGALDLYGRSLVIPSVRRPKPDHRRRLEQAPAPWTARGLRTTRSARGLKRARPRLVDAVGRATAVHSDRRRPQAARSRARNQALAGADAHLSADTRDQSRHGEACGRCGSRGTRRCGGAWGRCGRVVDYARCGTW